MVSLSPKLYFYPGAGRLEMLFNSSGTPCSFTETRLASILLLTTYLWYLTWQTFSELILFVKHVGFIKTFERSKGRTFGPSCAQNHSVRSLSVFQIYLGCLEDTCLMKNLPPFVVHAPSPSIAFCYEVPNIL